MEDKIEERICEICKEKATNICFDCSFYLCDSCFRFIHEKKANLEHKKEEIDPFISIDIKCPEHSKSQMNLFCIDEKGNKYFIIFNFINSIFMPIMPF